MEVLPLPMEIVKYLLVVCDQLNLSKATFQLTLSIACRYLRVRSNYQTLQLVVLTSLMMSCKFMETNPPEIGTYHKVSCNSFTSRGMG